MSIYQDSRGRDSARLVGVNWRNLLSSCQSVWEGKHDGLVLSPDEDDDNWSVVQTATIIAFESRSLTWAAVERQLEPVRLLAGRVDSEWNG